MPEKRVATVNFIALVGCFVVYFVVLAADGNLEDDVAASQHGIVVLEVQHFGDGHQGQVNRTGLDGLLEGKGEYLSVHGGAVYASHSYIIVKGSEGAVGEVVEIGGGSCHPLVFDAEQGRICHNHLYLCLADGQGNEIVEVAVLEGFIVDQTLLFGEDVVPLNFDVLAGGGVRDDQIVIRNAAKNIRSLQVVLCFVMGGIKINNNIGRVKILNLLFFLVITEFVGENTQFLQCIQYANIELVQGHLGWVLLFDEFEYEVGQRYADYDILTDQEQGTVPD